ncbi:MAG TPA: pyridoxal-phosphate dependent enzyme, partial [Vicinamibacterales bacterium]
ERPREGASRGAPGGEAPRILIEDGRDAAIAEGAGTIAVELLESPEPIDDIVVPVGDGALVGGVARWVKAHRPSARVVGVVAAGAPAMERSWRAGRAQALDRADTIADGISVQSPFAEAVTDMIGVVDEMLLVQDDQMVSAMRLAVNELGIVLEPSGAAGLAAILANPTRFRGRSTATILTGGNLTAAQMEQWLA